MSIYQFGLIIRQRREELGYSQEELSDGICSVPTLSRIENGERMPTKEHFEMLLQRLGYSDTTQDAYVDEQAFLLHELKYKIRQAIILNQTQDAKKLLALYTQKADPASRIAQQFILLYQTLAEPECYTLAQQLAQLQKAIRLTCPKYDENKFPFLLSYEEALVLNNIAVCRFEMKDTGTAINLLYSLKRYYENRMVNAEEILRTQPMVLYNLSKFLGCAERYDECIEICVLGIRVARETGRCTYLGRMLYNRAWSLLRRNLPGDRESAEASAREALYMATAMAQTASMEHYQRFLAANFPEKATETHDLPAHHSGA